MNASASFPNAKGAVLLTVIVVILIMGIVGVTLYSLTYTSTFTQLAAQNSARSFFLAESGFRVVASEYTHAAAASKNAVLEGLHNTTLTLPDNAGQFDLRIYPYWFYVDSAYAALSDTIDLKLPGGFPLINPSDADSGTLDFPETGALKVRGKTQRAILTTPTTVIGDAITYSLSTPFPFDIEADDEIFLVYADGATTSQEINLNGSLILPYNATSAFFPARNGVFRLYNENNDKTDYTYRYRLPEIINPDNLPADITLTQIEHQDPDNESLFPFTVDSNSEIFLGKNLAVFSASTYGQGVTAGKKEVGEYTDVGLDGGFGTGKETISFLEDIADFEPTMNPVPADPEDPAPIQIDLTTKTVRLGGGLTDGYGALWYKGDTDIANCIDGKCNFGRGFNAYFEFQSADIDNHAESKSFGDGFTFAILSGENYSDGDSGAGGEYLGYAGAGLSSSGLMPPKMALEIDTYPNPGEANICGSNSRNDGPPDANHAALVYWGAEAVGSFDAIGAPGDHTVGHIRIGSQTPVPNGPEDWRSTAGTISFWFKWRSGERDYQRRLWGQHDNMELRFESDGDLILDWGGNGESFSPALRVPEPFSVSNKWYFLAVSWDEDDLNNEIYVYIGDQTSLTRYRYAWTGSVTANAGITENLFLNSSGGDLSRNYRVDGMGSDLRYYNTARKPTDPTPVINDFRQRLMGNETGLQAYYLLQGDFLNAGPLSLSAGAVGTLDQYSWSASEPPLSSCGSGAASYDDNRHESGGGRTPQNATNSDAGSGDDGYYHVSKPSGEPNWLEDGEIHKVRLEVIRSLEALDPAAAEKFYEYNLKAWIDIGCEDSCTPSEEANFRNVRSLFSDWSPKIEKTILLPEADHLDLKNFLFGFTQGTGGASQNITLSNFEIYFLKRYP